MEPRLKTARLILSDRCLSVCLSVTLVYCGQTAGWISMPLGTKVGLGPGDIIVLDGDPAPHGKAPFPQIDIIGAMVIVWRVSYSM